MNLTIFQKIVLHAVLLIVSGVPLISGHYTDFWTGALYAIVGFSTAGLFVQGIKYLNQNQT